MNSTLVAVFEVKQDAENLLQFLTDRGLTAALADLTLEGPGNAIPADFAKYQVRAGEESAEAARQATWHTEEGLRLVETAVRCPECGSSCIIYPEEPHNFVLPALMRVLVQHHVVAGSYCCLSCRHEWAPAKSVV